MNRKYDEQKRSQADKAALLRGVVAGYIIFLGWKIATNKDTTMDVTTARIIGGVFIAAALGFCVYIYLRRKSDLEAARLTDEDREASQNKSEDEIS